MTLVDIIVTLNLVLIFGSFFLAIAILFSLREGEYVLAKGWRYIFPAVIILAVLKTYEFFTQYGFYTPSRLISEVLSLLFTIFIFTGLLVQFLAIREAFSKRA